jgi:hypothetical protein
MVCGALLTAFFVTVVAMLVPFLTGKCICCSKGASKNISRKGPRNCRSLGYAPNDKGDGDAIEGVARE